MILVFGGTTEGSKAIEVLEEGGGTFFYSTKTGEQNITLHHGIRIDGALDAEAMQTFCQEHAIRLLIDAAHPFASQLHRTIIHVAEKQNIPVIRYDRIYPPRDADITWIDDYTQIPQDIQSLLATTGVQSIAKLKPLEAEGIKIYYRILNRKSSIDLAKKQGADMNQICFYEDPKDIPVQTDAILLKESGLSGGFLEKVEAARKVGMKIIALKRPPYPSYPPSIERGRGGGFTINGPHGLRRAVEQLLPEFYPLHSGLTTGTCATAAAIAATLRMVRGKGLEVRNQGLELPSKVPVILPNGETIMVAVGYGEGYAYCIKESGDDPDVTNGIEIRASVTSHLAPRTSHLVPRTSHLAPQIMIEAGEGIGRFTLPGFDYPPGEPAINKGPREMIRQNLSPLLSSLLPPPSTLHQLTVTLSVPEGAEIARRTFNPRLGIEGGISIIGVSGIIKPFSEEAFIDSIRKCMQVAKASGTERVVINSGAKSERFVKALYPDLPSQAFVEYGNYIGETLKIAHELNIPKVTLGVMLGKAVKLAEGQLDTHSRKGTMNKAFIAQMLREASLHLAPSTLHTITLARELWELIPANGLQAFADVVIAHCQEHCDPLLPNGELTILLITDEGDIYRPASIKKS